MTIKKTILILLISMFSTAVFAQQSAKPSTQYMLIVRFKSNFVPPSNEAIQSNIKKWQEYMGNLAQTGKIAGGYRPGNDGITISGTSKVEKKGAYVAENEMISSVIIIYAVDINEAKAIANKCPVFEFGGSIEVRPLTETDR
jgi:hypothetical protein